MDERYEQALKAALSDIMTDPEVVGILFTGSVQQGRPAITSDLDLHVVTHKDHYYRATRMYAGVEAELFFNNVPSMRWRITKPDDFQTAAGFATGKVLLDRTGELAELVSLAKQRWEAGPPAPTAEQVCLIRYGLHDLCEDLKDVEHDPVTSRLVGAALVKQALETFCKLNHCWGDKLKRLADYVRQRDPYLDVLVHDYFAGGMHPQHAYEIVDHVLAPVGGRLQVWESEKVKYPGGTQA